MNEKKNKKLPVYIPAIIILIIVYLIFKNNSIGSLFVKFLLLALIVICVIVLLLTLAATVFAVQLGKKDYDKRHPVEKKKEAGITGEKVPEKAVKEEPPEVKEARRVLSVIDQHIEDTADVQVKAEAMEARCKACRVVDTITSQNAEIRKNRELFSYYLPTFEHILQKYLVIEKGGIDGAVAKEKALSSCRKLSEVFEKMYKDLYADDMMDLSVEERALESIIKKDGY